MVVIITIKTWIHSLLIFIRTKTVIVNVQFFKFDIFFCVIFCFKKSLSSLFLFNREKMLMKLLIIFSAISMICSTDPNELMSAKKIKINIPNDDNVLTENMIRSPIIIDDWYTASSASKDPEYHDKLNVSFVCNFLLLPH